MPWRPVQRSVAGTVMSCAGVPFDKLVRAKRGFVRQGRVADRDVKPVVGVRLDRGIESTVAV